jgi:hypothetical protein
MANTRKKHNAPRFAAFAGHAEVRHAFAGVLRVLDLHNRHTRRAYQHAIADFMQFTGIVRPEEFRTVTRAHAIAWRDDLVRREDGERRKQDLA